MIIADESTIIRLPLAKIQISRVAQESKLMYLKSNQKVSTFTQLKSIEEIESQINAVFIWYF